MSSTEPEHAYLKCVTDFKKIHDSPLNLSPSKQLYSFSRSKRFNDKTSQSLCGQAFYDVSNKIYQGHQGTGIGCGNKYDFTKHSKNVPAPNEYKPQNLTISESVGKKHGYTFGVSREMFKQSEMVFHLKNAATIPGPDAYFPKIQKTQACVTMKSRIVKPENKAASIGPGQYVIPPAFQTDKPLFNSRHKNTKGIRFPPIGKIDSGKENKNATAEQNDSIVGTGELSKDTKFQMNGKGSYYNSKYHNTPASLFPKQSRSMETKKAKDPGPGDYQMPSEFGIYKSSKFTS